MQGRTSVFSHSVYNLSLPPSLPLPVRACVDSTDLYPSRSNTKTCQLRTRMHLTISQYCSIQLKSDTAELARGSQKITRSRFTALSPGTTCIRTQSVFFPRPTRCFRRYRRLSSVNSIWISYTGVPFSITWSCCCCRFAGPADTCILPVGTCGPEMPAVCVYVYVYVYGLRGVGGREILDFA